MEQQHHFPGNEKISHQPTTKKKKTKQIIIIKNSQSSREEAFPIGVLNGTVDGMVMGCPVMKHTPKMLQLCFPPACVHPRILQPG